MYSDTLIMEKESFLQKVNTKAWFELRKHLKGKAYLLSFRSYWHFLLNKNKNTSNETCYYAARPNLYAGIGHQLANWISGYWFAKQLNLKFAHIPLVSDKWENFLGFGENEAQFYDLKRKGYKVRRLPKFNENNPGETALNKEIINSYNGSRKILLACQDQLYRDQYGLMDVIKQKFYNASSRKKDQLIYSTNHFNIAMHVRRGDILSDPNVGIRFNSNEYFIKVLNQVFQMLDTDKEIHVYFFSQGKPENYPEFSEVKNLHWCFNLGEQDSFLHMVYADLLITSKSSFSYKPALLNDGIKVCPKDFWHSYPKTTDWILADNEGNFETNQILSKAV